MSKKRTAEYHLKQAWKCINEVATLDGTQGKRFLILKKKAAKHVLKAKQIDPNAQIFARRSDVQKMNKLVSAPPVEGNARTVPVVPSTEGAEAAQLKSHEKRT